MFRHLFFIPFPQRISLPSLWPVLYVTTTAAADAGKHSSYASSETRSRLDPEGRYTIQYSKCTAYSAEVSKVRRILNSTTGSGLRQSL